RQQRGRQLLLKTGRGQQRRVGRVHHVAALDEHLRDRGEVEPGQVVAELDAVAAVVVAHWHACAAQERGADVAAEPFRGRDDVVVRPVGDGGGGGPPAARGGAAGGGEGAPRAGAGVVEVLGPPVHARPDAVVVRPGHHHARAVGDQRRP